MEQLSHQTTGGTQGSGMTSASSECSVHPGGGQVSCAGVVREVFLGEVAFELGPEGIEALGLAERREVVPTQRAGPHGGRTFRVLEEKAEAERRKCVVCVGGGEACPAPAPWQLPPSPGAQLRGKAVHSPRPCPSRPASGLAHWPTGPPGPGTAH